MFRLTHRFARPLTVLWALVILALSITPGQELPDIQFWEFDKFAHIGVYGLLTFLACAAFATRSAGGIGGIPFRWFVLIGAVLYGVAIECVQGAWIPQRYFDVFDILANALGSVAGALAYGFFARRMDFQANWK